MKEVILDNWILFLAMFAALTIFLIWVGSYADKTLDGTFDLKQNHDEHEDFPGS